MSRSSVVSTLLRIIVITNLEVVILASNTTDYRFYSSCDTAEYVVAIKKCNEINGILFNATDLGNTNALNIVDRAIEEHHVIWIKRTTDQDQDSNCSVVLQFNRSRNSEYWDCTRQVHYVCKNKSDDGTKISFNDAYTPCPRENHGPPTSRSGESGSNIKPPSPRRLSANTIVVIGVCIAVPLLLICIILTACCVLKRNKKPKRYAVREESAIYHRNHPRPETDDKDTAPKDANQMTNAGFVIGLEVPATSSNGEYDILWKTNNAGVEVTSEGSSNTGLYGHLVRNSNNTNCGDVSIYDTTAQPDFDTRPVDNPYARTYLPEQ